MVDLVDQVFQPANLIETVEKAATAVAYAGFLHVKSAAQAPAMWFSVKLSMRRSLVMTVPRSYRVSTENGWKSVQAPVVQKVDNAIHRINHYPLDS